MQIQILKPDADGKHYPNYDELIKNARDNDERDYLIRVKKRHEEWKAKGYSSFDGFTFGIVYTAKMACGHYELFQHPIYREYGKEPDEDDIMDSIEDVIETVRLSRAEKMKCTKCTCGFR